MLQHLPVLLTWQVVYQRLLELLTLQVVYQHLPVFPNLQVVYLYLPVLLTLQVVISAVRVHACYSTPEYPAEMISVFLC